MYKSNFQITNVQIVNFLNSKFSNSQVSKDWLFVVSRDNIFPSVCLLVAQSATGGTLDSLRSLLGIPSVELFFIDVIIYWWVGLGTRKAQVGLSLAIISPPYSTNNKVNQFVSQDLSFIWHKPLQGYMATRICKYT